jgi:hypothetical protein
MTPVLVTPPTDAILTRDEVAGHLRITSTAEDSDLLAFISAATAHLDGWHGILGRCIMPQTWSVTAESGGVVLPMPDVTTANAAYSSGNAALEIVATSAGPYVEVSEACTVTFTCAMPSHLLPVAKMAAKLIIAHWYENRSATGEGLAELPLAFDALTTAIRHRGV